MHTPGVPLPRFILAADATRSITSYTNDQIWELVVDRGEPPALAVETTFGLRARNFRIFPRFTYNKRTVSNPTEFDGLLSIRPVSPGYIKLVCPLFEPINLTYELWVADSQTICGILNFHNTAKNTQSIQVELSAILSPLATGWQDSERMTFENLNNMVVLAGKSNDLYPLLFVPKSSPFPSSPFPSLQVELDIAPNQVQQVRWVHTASDSVSNAFELARSVTSRRWEAELARLEMAERSLVHIITGSSAWDIALERAHIIALRLLQSSNENSGNPFYVLSRLPDHGYSIRGDGTDYGTLWSGYTALQTYYLSSFLLPTAPDIANQLIRNFLNAQKEDGSINWRIQSGVKTPSTRTIHNATPILARLMWRLFEFHQNREIINFSLTALNHFFESWFLPDRDHDGDGIPEWSSPVQSGLEDNPIYAHWLDGTPGLDISTVESPDLCAFLYSEAQALLNMAHLVERKDISRSVQKRIKVLKSAVEKCFVTKEGSYRSRDRQTHLISKGEVLGKRIGPGDLSIMRRFLPAVRLCIAIKMSEGTLRRPTINIHGAAVPNAEALETLEVEDFRWRPGMGHTTSQLIFIQIVKVSIDGVGPEDEIIVSTADHTTEDLTGLLPLWAGIPDKRRVNLIIRQALQNPNRFSRPFGLPTTTLSTERAPDPSYHLVHFPWNALIIEALVSYGYYEIAASLFSRLMQAACNSLQKEGSFRRYYHAETGAGFGEIDALEGLPSYGLFLEVVGVKVMDEQHILIHHHNPFPWPVTVKFRGTTILHQADKTTIIFSNGQTTIISDSRPHQVKIN